MKWRQTVSLCRLMFHFIIAIQTYHASVPGIIFPARLVAARAELAGDFSIDPSICVDNVPASGGLAGIDAGDTGWCSHFVE